MLSDRQCCDFAAATYDSYFQWDHLLQGDADDDVYIGIKKLPGVDVVACRGSDCNLDWERDIDAIPYLDPRIGYVHGGFYRGVPKAYLTLKPLITQPVIMTGHSLGGSHAQLVASEFVLDGVIPAKVCCFGSPKVGYQRFADVVTPITNYTLYKNGPDYVTDVPMTLPDLPFLHARPLSEILEIPTTNVLSLFAFHAIGLYAQGMPDA